MYTRIKTLLFVCGLLVFPLSINAQGTTGTEFWCGFMENLDPLFNGPPDFVLQIHADQTAEGFIEVPATGLTIPFDAIGGTVTEVTLPDALWYSEGSEFVDNKGIRITSDMPVDVTAIHYRLYFTEATRLLSTPELGTEYRITCYEDFDQFSPTTFVIVSTADNTEVEITPSTLTEGLQPAGVPFTVTLDEGQSYQVKASGNLSGTRVRSLTGQPLAVFSGAQQGNVGPCIGAADSHMYDQAVPVDGWEDTYFFIPFSGQGSDPVVIVSDNDNTEVFFNCQSIAVLDEGEFFEIPLQDPGLITATDPISVAQFNSSQECNPSGIGDPNMLQLFPANRRFTDLRFRVTTGPNGVAYVTNHFINLVTETSGIGSVQLDGNNIAGEFLPIPAYPEFSYAQIVLPPGLHEITSTSPLWGTRYSFGDFDALTANLGYVQDSDVDVACLEIEADGLFCVDSLITFSAVANGQVVTYDWSFGNGEISDEEAPAVMYDASGTYTVTLTVTYANGNTNTVSLELEIFDCPEEPCEDPGLIIQSIGDPCTGITFSLSPTIDFVSYDWDFGDFNGSTDANPTHVYSFQGNYPVTVTVTDAFNCTYMVATTIPVPNCSGPCQGAGEVELFFTGTPCVDSILTFFNTANFDPDDPPIFDEWSFSTGDLLLGPDSVQLSFSQPGIYSVDFSALQFPDCEYFGTLEFEIVADCDDPCINQPALSIVPTDNFCVDSLLTFSAQTSAELTSYEWTFSTGLVIAEPAASTAFPDAGVYSVTLQATDVNGCTYEETFAFDIEDCAPCTDPGLTIVQEGDPCTEIIFSLEPAQSFASYFWDLDNLSTSTDAEPVTSYPDAGTYLISVEVVDFDGCVYTASIALETEPCADPCAEDYTVLVEVSGPLCADSVLTLSVVSDVPNPLGYVWTISGGFVIGSGSTVGFTTDQVGMFNGTVTVNNADECFWEGPVTFEVVDCSSPEDCSVFFPNAFSPNGDGTNDRFGVFYGCVPEDYFLQVFDRWGNLVFESSDPAFRWDGQIEGNTAPQAVYAWRSVYTLDGASVEEYGDVTLLR